MTEQIISIIKFIISMAKNIYFLLMALFIGFFAMVFKFFKDEILEMNPIILILFVIAFFGTIALLSLKAKEYDDEKEHELKQEQSIKESLEKAESYFNDAKDKEYFTGEVKCGNNYTFECKKYKKKAVARIKCGKEIIATKDLKLKDTD